MISSVSTHVAALWSRAGLWGDIAASPRPRTTQGPGGGVITALGLPERVGKREKLR